MKKTTVEPLRTAQCLPRLPRGWPQVPMIRLADLCPDLAFTQPHACALRMRGENQGGVVDGLEYRAGLARTLD